MSRSGMVMRRRTNSFSSLSAPTPRVSRRASFFLKGDLSGVKVGDIERVLVVLLRDLGSGSAGGPNNFSRLCVLSFVGVETYVGRVGLTHVLAHFM